MFEKFSDYMWYLLHAPLKVKRLGSSILTLFIVLGILFDELKEQLLSVQKQGNILTATDRYLDLCGRDRNIPRLKNEDDESYRKRLLMKVEVAQRAGTLKGLEVALDAMGYEVEIRPAYLEDETRWAEFWVILDEELDRHEVYDFKMIKQTVMEVKQASAKPNYGFRYHIGIENLNKLETHIRYTIPLNFYNNIPLYLDGTWQLDGSYSLSGLKLGKRQESRVSIKVGTSIKSGSSCNGSVEMDAMWLLDGTYLLDGSKKLNGSIWKEELA